MSPKTINRITWANRILVLLMTLCGAVAAFEWIKPVMVSNIVGGVGVLFGITANWCAGLLPPPDAKAARPGSSTVAIVLACCLVSSAACGAMWRVTASIREAGTLIDRGISGAHKVKREACKKAHGAKTLPFAKCLTESREHTAFQQWRRYGMPGLNTGLVTTVMTLTLYDRAAGKKLSWELFVKLIKPLACGLARAATAWKDLLKEKGAVVLGIVTMIEGVSCAE